MDNGRAAGASAVLSNKGTVPTLDLAMLQEMKDPFHRYDMSVRSLTHEERDLAKESARNTYRPAIQPAWLKHDRQVLQFDAYFQEPVHESPKETFRIRCCKILYYLEDGTMMIQEPKIENSGIPQGSFVKRHRIPKPGNAGGYYTYTDLIVGATISIYSRAFRITACDDFTRYFYQVSAKQEVPANEEIPLDSFRAAEMPEEEPSRKALQLESKEYSNIALGGNRRNAKLQQYLENDRKVLRFECYWDDQTRYGTRMYYTLHYYLSDDSIEMLENLPRNAGRDPYPVFWRRSPLRKNPHVSPAPGMDEPEAVIYKPEDLIVGESINVLSRDIVLYSCDDFTRSFYRSYMDHEQDSYPIEQPKITHVKLSHPPHHGFGSEEDSLASCVRLMPRPPRRDEQKLMADADKVIRFEATMPNDTFEDENRRFIVAIFLADGHVCVWELKQRNSGHSEGKFASKSKKKNPATGKFFTPSDFYIGAILEINASPFHLVGADQAALNYMEDNCKDFPFADVSQVLTKVEPLSDMLQGAGNVECADFQQFALDRGIDLVDHELITLARNFGQYDVSRNVAFLDGDKVVAAMEGALG